MTDHHNLIAYLATLLAIALMSVVAAVICVTVDAQAHLAQIVASLGFIGAAVTGLIGVIGTFKSRQDNQSNLEKAIDKIPPATGEAAEGTKS